MEPVTDEQLSAWGRAIVARRWAKRHEETCVVCGTTFQAKSGQQYCSPACRFHATYVRTHARTPLEEKPCAVCGTLFSGRTRYLYCSEACARRGQALKRAERKQEISA